MFTTARLAMAAAVGSLALAAGAANANPLPDGGMTLTEIQTWLKSQGLEATVDADHSLVLAVIDGQKVAVFAGDCVNQRCQSIQYYYGVIFKDGVKPDDASAMAWANAFNRRFRWAKVCIDDNRNVMMETDFALTPNVDSEALNHSLLTFVEEIPVFRDYIRSTR